jgi:hypothetical protein
MTNKTWNLIYAIGNTERIVGDANNPQTRKKALEGAATIEKNGWRVWVEHATTNARIFESEREKAHREGTPWPPVRSAGDEIIAKIRDLADQLATERGTPLAVVLVEPTDPDYGEVAPQLLMEDVLCAPQGKWPAGFSLTLLNKST